MGKLSLRSLLLHLQKLNTTNSRKMKQVTSPSRRNMRTRIISTMEGTFTNPHSSWISVQAITNNRQIFLRCSNRPLPHQWLKRNWITTYNKLNSSLITNPLNKLIPYQVTNSLHKSNHLIKTINKKWTKSRSKSSCKRVRTSQWIFRIPNSIRLKSCTTAKSTNHTCPLTCKAFIN